MCTIYDYKLITVFSFPLFPLVPSSPLPEDIEILDDYKLKEILDLLKKRPLMAGSDGIRLSLAGAQDKIAVGIKGNDIILIKGTTPTTHILKPLLDTVKDSVSRSNRPVILYR